MPARRSADPRPDPSSPTASDSSGSKASVAAEQPASPPRYVLPKDLNGSLRRLSDPEIDALFSAVTAEAARRGRLPKRQHPAEPIDRRTVAGNLTKGKLNAVRAAFKAGVKPSAIARQFGISQADVREALTAMSA